MMLCVMSGQAHPTWVRFNTDSEQACFSSPALLHEHCGELDIKCHNDLSEGSFGMHKNAVKVAAESHPDTACSRFCLRLNSTGPDLAAETDSDLNKLFSAAHVLSDELQRGGKRAVKRLHAKVCAPCMRA